MSGDDDKKHAGEAQAEETSKQSPKSAKRISITTSAVTYVPESPDQASGDPQVEKKNLRTPPAPWSKSEPLTKIHSLLGHMAQGDVYRNDLDLVYDRLKGDAEAPEFIPPPQDKESTDQRAPLIDQSSELIHDPFSDDSFDFGMSVGEVSQDDVSSGGDQTEGADDGAYEPIQAESQTIFGEINLNDFDELHQTARTSIGFDPKVLEGEGAPQDDLNDEHLAKIAEAPEDWSESSVDPSEARRERGVQNDFPFFESSQAINVEVIQGGEED